MFTLFLIQRLGCKLRCSFFCTVIQMCSYDEEFQCQTCHNSVFKCAYVQSIHAHCVYTNVCINKNLQLTCLDCVLKIFPNIFIFQREKKQLQVTAQETVHRLLPCSAKNVPASYKQQQQIKAAKTSVCFKVGSRKH